MRPPSLAPIALPVIASALVLAIAGCGESNGVGQGKLSDALRLEETEDGKAMDGDLLCVVSELLNSRDEVEAAVEADAPVVVSRDATLGIEVVPPFAPDCEERARKALNRLERQSE
jgi:hypothetical protein